MGDPQWSSGQHRRLGIGRSAVRIPPRQKIFLLSPGPIDLCRVPSIQKYTGEMESEGRWKAKRKCETRLESWISKAVSSILAGSHRSSPGPIDPKVYWGDGNRGEMESEERGYQCGAILHALL
jgi:hypothetical protein